MTPDASGRSLEVGLDVAIVALRERFASNLPPEERTFVETCVGRTCVITDFVGEGDVEVSLTDPETRIVHFLCVPGASFRLVDRPAWVERSS